MPSFRLENQHGRKEGRIICGVDEAGRGPLAGPVVAAALIIPENFPKKIAKRIKDSKQMNEEEREELYPLLLEHCAASIALATVDEIDLLNILRASLMAMGRAVENLRGSAAAMHSYIHSYGGSAIVIDAAIVDGNMLPPVGCPAHAYVAGDDKSLSIAAASILAKVARDRLMRELHQAFPHYGFAGHKGYSTPEHLAALRTHGPCQHHRQSFAPVREWQNPDYWERADTEAAE
jgi:ribonuclease HII